MTTTFNSVTKILAISAVVFISSCTKTPEACFVSDKGKAAKVNEEIQFSTTCSKDADTYSWNFGDGATATGTPTKHKYPIAANYTVTLTVSNKSKTATSSQIVTISQ